MHEWLEHYLSMGVEHFYMINNNSDDGYRAILGRYQRDACLDLFHCERDSYQIGAYTELLPMLCDEVDWIAALDLDEFIYAPRHGTLGTVLQQFVSQEAVLVPWLSFGSSGHMSQPASVIDGFLRRGPANVSRAFLKSITRPASIIEFSQHNPITRLGRKMLANGTSFGDESFIRLEEVELKQYFLLNNHYRLQSRSYFLQVKTRRPEVHESTAGQSKELTFFESNDQHWNSVTDARLSELRAAKR